MSRTFPLERRRASRDDARRSNRPNLCHWLEVLWLLTRMPAGAPRHYRVRLPSLWADPAGPLVKWFDPKPRPLITGGQSALQTGLRAESLQCSRTESARMRLNYGWNTEGQTCYLFSTRALIVLFSWMHKHRGVSVLSMITYKGLKRRCLFMTWQTYLSKLFQAAFQVRGS